VRPNVPEGESQSLERSGPLTNTSAQISTKLVGRITPQLKLRTSSIKALANGERNPQIVRLLQRTLGRCHEMRDANSIAWCVWRRRRRRESVPWHQ